MEPLDVKTIAARSVQGSLFTVGASAITTVSGFIRSVLLARLLLPEHFGVVTLAMFFLLLTMQVQRFGLHRAFIHRQDDSLSNLRTFATLRVGLTAIAVVLSLLAAPILARFYPGHPGLAPVLMVLALFEVLQAFNGVAQTLLEKALNFRRLALLDVASSLAMTVVAPTIAWLGGGVWALVAEQVTGVLVRTAGLWLYRPPWQPAFGLDRELAKWYFRFGSFVFANANLTFLLDRFDDFWTGTFLGATALGFYSRAYEFARYPRRVLSRPIVQVFFPVFAQLQDDRLHLSKAFYRVCSLIVRVGFLAFGTFALVAPEFIRIFLGEKWLPMVVTFQLMLIYALFDPLTSICANLLNALGQPKVNGIIQFIRVVVFIPAIIILAYFYDINGVAIAVDLTLIIGICLWFKYVRYYVDFSIRQMLFAPILGVILGGITATILTRCIGLSNEWIGLIVKGITVTAIYLSVTIALEGKNYLVGLRVLWNYFPFKMKGHV